MGNEEALQALMVAYQDGDLEAFDRLYGALEPELRGFLRARCHDPQRVDDLLQETFLQLHRSRRGYLPGLPVRPWVYAIAKRVFLMHVRRVRRRESRELTELSAAPEPDAPAEADRLTDRSALMSALGQVPADGRRAFLLHHWPGFVGALCGLAAGVLADSGWRLACEVSAPSHVLVSHGLAVALTAIGGYAASSAIDAMKH